MTNKEHLTTLSSLEWVQRVDWLYHGFGKFYTDTPVAIMDWLDKEYKPVRPMQPNMPDVHWYYCHVCYTATLEKEPKCYKCCTDFDWSETP